MEVELTPFQLSCRPDGCARLCTDEGLRAADACHRKRLLGAARRIVGDSALAEEAVQDALAHAWRSCASFDPEGGPLVAWLLVLTRNAAIDIARWRSRRPPVAGYDGPIDAAAVESDIQPHDLLGLRAELVEAMSTLGTLHQRVLVETILRDRSPAEVAAELGIPSGTVRSRAHYALRHLRLTLETSRVCA